MLVTELRCLSHLLNVIARWLCEKIVDIGDQNCQNCRQHQHYLHINSSQTSMSLISTHQIITSTEVTVWKIRKIYFKKKTENQLSKWVDSVFPGIYFDVFQVSEDSYPDRTRNI